MQHGQADACRRIARTLYVNARLHRAAGVDIFEGFYQAYLTAFGCGVAVLLSSDAIGDHKLDASQLHDVITGGPGLIGLGIAVSGAVAAVALYALGGARALPPRARRPAWRLAP